MARPLRVEYEGASQLRTPASAAAAKGKLRKKLIAIDKAICAEINGEQEAPDSAIFYYTDETGDPIPF